MYDEGNKEMKKSMMNTEKCNEKKQYRATKGQGKINQGIEAKKGRKNGGP